MKAKKQVTLYVIMQVDTSYDDQYFSFNEGYVPMENHVYDDKEEADAALAVLLKTFVEQNTIFEYYSADNLPKEMKDDLETVEIALHQTRVHSADNDWAMETWKKKNSAAWYHLWEQGYEVIPYELHTFSVGSKKKTSVKAETKSVELRSIELT